MKYPTIKSVCPFCSYPLTYNANTISEDYREYFDCNKYDDHQFFFGSSSIPPIFQFFLVVDKFESGFCDGKFYVKLINQSINVNSFDFNDSYNEIIRCKKLQAFI